MRVSLGVVAMLAACGKDPGTGGAKDPGTTFPTDWECVQPVDGGAGCEGPDELPMIGCDTDFAALASLPLDSSIPGARSVKTVLDRLDGDNLHFQNSVKYPIHWEFASSHLGALQGYPPVPELGQFNQSEYYSGDRRFILGAVVYYEEPDLWTYEIAPYDTADATMVSQAYRAIRDNAFFGADLFFHPSSSTQDDQVVPALPDDVKIVTTEELYAGVDYQAYNLGCAMGLLRFRTAAEVDGTYTPFREIVVLDAVPNDISIVAAIITSEFQTPLAHINVLSINRGSPNMGLRDAQDNPELLALEGKWVELCANSFDYTIREVSQAEADAWWDAEKPEPLDSPDLDLTVTDLRLVGDIIDETAPDLALEIDVGISSFGSKGTNYAAIYDLPDDTVPMQPAYVIPFYWYDKHMRDNGLDQELLALFEDPQWGDPEYREVKLEEFKAKIVAAPIDPQLIALVNARRSELWPTEDSRFRSSTNAEDLGNFTGAGLYNSITGEHAITDPAVDSVEWAIKTAWSNLWNPRAYEERYYYGIDQLAVAMALLTTPNFPEEEANGVAITNNLFDTSGLEPAFIVNTQVDNWEVVQPALGVLPDAFIHYFYTSGAPVVYTSHSNIIPAGYTVLDAPQINALGNALDAIHKYLYSVYGDDGEWYGLEVDFKFDDKNSTPGDRQLYLKQARPLPWTPGGSPLSICEEL